MIERLNVKQFTNELEQFENNLIKGGHSLSDIRRFTERYKQLVKLKQCDAHTATILKQKLDHAVKKVFIHSLEGYDTKESLNTDNRQLTESDFLYKISNNMAQNSRTVNKAEKLVFETSENLLSIKNIYKSYYSALNFAGKTLNSAMSKTKNDRVFLFYAIRTFNIICVTIILQKLYILNLYLFMFRLIRYIMRLVFSGIKRIIPTKKYVVKPLEYCIRIKAFDIFQEFNVQINN